MMRLLMAIALLLPLPALAARDPDAGFTQIRAGTPFSMRADRAYILFRVPKAKGVLLSDTVFLREIDPTVANMMPNLVSARVDWWFAETEAERFYLIEAVPGSYVIAGQAMKGVRYVATCFCMGTLRFEAKLGAIADLGYILSDDPSGETPFPELRELSGRGDRIDDGTNTIFVAAIRPVTENTPVPEVLRKLPRAPANFRAVGKFTNSFARLIYRMAPLDGVLAYDEDRVIDLRAGQ